MNDSTKNKFLNNLVNKSTEHPIVTIKNNIYTNHLLGTSFKIPKKWNVISIQRFQKEGKKQIFSDQFEAMKPELFELFESPVIVLTKLDIDNDEFDGLISPTINLSIDVKEGEYKEMELIEYADELDIEEDESLVKKFKIKKKGEIFEKDGFQFILYDYEYLCEHEEIENPVMVEFSVLNIDYNDFFLEFNMTQCKIQNQNADKEFNSFIESIKLNV